MAAVTYCSVGPTINHNAMTSWTQMRRLHTGRYVLHISHFWSFKMRTERCSVVIIKPVFSKILTKDTP